MDFASRSLEKRQGFADAFSELFERCFVVVELWRFNPCEACRAILGLITHDLNLSAKREHVRRETPADQHGGFNFLCRGISRTFIEYGQQGIQADLEDRQGGLRHGHRHGTNVLKR